MRYSIRQQADHWLIFNPEGPVLGMSAMDLKESQGLAFKNLSGTPELLPYEDWRLPCEARARDLAARLTVEEIAGLMLWSPHQMVPFLPGLPFVGHYDGGDFRPGMDPAALTDEQIRFVREENIRNILLTLTQSAEVSARWNNKLQTLAEESRLGIPVCISSDPRHAAGKKSAEFSGTGKEVSR